MSFVACVAHLLNYKNYLLMNYRLITFCYSLFFPSYFRFEDVKVIVLYAKSRNLWKYIICDSRDQMKLRF